MAQMDSNSKGKKSKRDLSPTQEIALHALVNRDPSENMEETAKRAGVSKRTMYRYLENETFYNRFQSELKMLFRSARFPIATALIKSASNGNPQNQKLYWQLTGLLSEKIDVNVDPANNNPGVETVMIDVESLTPEMRAEFLRIARERQLSGRVEAENREEGTDVNALETLDTLDAIEIKALASDNEAREINAKPEPPSEPKTSEPKIDLDLFAAEEETEESETLW